MHKVSVLGVVFRTRAGREPGEEMLCGESTQVHACPCVLYNFCLKYTVWILIGRRCGRAFYLGVECVCNIWCV